MRVVPLMCASMVACAAPAAGVDEVDGGSASEIDAADTGDAAVEPLLPAFCDNYPPPDVARDAMSSRVWYGGDGLLEYARDADGNRVPDVGSAGYAAGARELPGVPEVARIG